MLFRILLCFLTCCAFETYGAESVQPVEVLFLGAFHMSNPGQDIANMKVDSVLTPNRQKELNALAEALAAYKPTLIMVEEEAQPPQFVSEAFTQFKREDLLKNPNERVQIAFRLADKLGIKKVYGIDEQSSKGEPDYFPFEKIEAYAKSHGLGRNLQDWTADINIRCAKKNEEFLKKGSISSLLIYLNGPDFPCAQQGIYNQLLRYGDGDNQPGAELNAAYYLRNAKIFSKLINIVKPGDRVFVLYGSGHAFWLKHFIQETPGFKLIDVQPFLKKANE